MPSEEFHMLTFRQAETPIIQGVGGRGLIAPPKRGAQPLNGS